MQLPLCLELCVTRLNYAISVLLKLWPCAYLCTCTVCHDYKKAEVVLILCMCKTGRNSKVMQLIHCMACIFSLFTCIFVTGCPKVSHCPFALSTWMHSLECTSDYRLPEEVGHGWFLFVKYDLFYEILWTFFVFSLFLHLIDKLLASR